MKNLPVPSLYIHLVSIHVIYILLSVSISFCVIQEDNSEHCQMLAIHRLGAWLFTARSDCRNPLQLSESSLRDGEPEARRWESWASGCSGSVGLLVPYCFFLSFVLISDLQKSSKNKTQEFSHIFHPDSPYVSIFTAVVLFLAVHVYKHISPV